MTRDEAKNRLEELRAKRDALVDQLADEDVQSASVSAGGGSKSYTNRTVGDLKSKIKFLDKEIAKLEARLGLRVSPGSIKTIGVRFR